MSSEAESLTAVGERAAATRAAAGAMRAAAHEMRRRAIWMRWHARRWRYDRYGPVVAMCPGEVRPRPAVGVPVGGNGEGDLVGEVGLAIVEAAPDALMLVSEVGQILLVNGQTERLFGYQRDELVGQPIEVLLPERFAQAHRAHRTRFRAEPRLRPMGAGLLLFGRRRDGAEFPVEISLSPLVTAEGLRVVAAVRDVSQRLLAEARVREIQRVLDGTRDAVLMFDPDTLGFTYVNQGAIDQLGYSRDELLAMTPLHIKPEMTEAAYRAMAVGLAPGQSHTYTTVHRRKDGADLWVEAVLVRPPVDPAGEGWLVSIARDLTDRLAVEARAHAAERQVALLEDRQRIARDLHDLVIQRLFAAGLGLSGIAAAVQDPSAAERINQVIDDLDDTIRQLRLSIFDLNRRAATTSLRATIIDVCRSERAALGFDPAVRLDGPIDVVSGDVTDHVVAVLREALSNTARHARASAVDITVIAGRDLTLQVTDNGIGPPPEGPHGGHGIQNMTTRAANLGGSLTIQAGIDAGTELIWRIPLS